MTFAHPYLLLLLLIVPAMVGWYLWRYRRQQAALNVPSLDSFGGHRTLRQRLFWLPYALRCAAVGLIIIALARPQTSLSHKETSVEGIDIVVAIDVSGTMMAEDFSPNRLEAAKSVAAQFIEGRKNDRISLVAFSGEAYTLVPLTIDHQVLLSQLHNLKSGQIKDGTAMGDGLATAINRIKDSEAKSKVIILLSDGVNNMGSVDPMSAAEIAALYGIRLYTIGIGTRGQAPYPAKDVFGRTHKVMMPVEIDEQLMTQMAQATPDGQYFRSTNKRSLKQIFDQVDQMEKSKVNVTNYSHKRDEYLPFLLAALLCFAFELILKAFYRL